MSSVLRDFAAADAACYAKLAAQLDCRFAFSDCLPVSPLQMSCGYYSQALMATAAGAEAKHTPPAMLGFYLARRVADIAELLFIGVAPSARRGGLGERLLQDLIQRSAAHGVKCLELEVRCSNAPAIALYEKHGFVRCGERPNYYASRGSAIKAGQALRESALLYSLDCQRG